ncbi:hypothetical protein [Singulisphaera sp. GP187]|uniref:hypothetical protein n=1 Tax=Singulisphaera sp. GP187 TaxID=1882752 RepID=UPI0009406978|nr:hypothetical protein [Singulisphaera sp. GP187]
MAGVPLKFRCYQCNQLLGVSRGRVGTVVACPKCRADLIVPDPDEAEGADVSQSPRFTETSEEGISLDLLDIRPEDIRVEPGVNWTPPLAESAPREPYPSVPPEPDPPVPSAVSETTSPIDLGGLTGTTTEAAPKVTEAVVPPIQFESTRIAETRVVSTRSRDVVLPRSAVATWSLFVLLAQAFAFVAGLLAGHFLWRVH